jgi:hypothetical protein
MKELVGLENGLNVPLLARKCMNALQFRRKKLAGGRASRIAAIVLRHLQDFTQAEIISST